MPNVLTTTSAVVCPHQARVATSGASKLRISGNPVLLPAGIQAHSVTACPTADSSTPTTKCRTVVSVTGGQATKLSVAGIGVMLDSLVGATDGVSPAGNALSAQSNQTKLTAS
jgi:hypothetical protein